MSTRRALAVAVLSLSCGCTLEESNAPPVAPPAAGPPGPYTVCKDPRPEICTMDYRPVCGFSEENGWKTYSNGCSACSRPEVVHWVDGACPQTQ